MEHRQQIALKFVDIMRERVEFHWKTMKTTDWKSEHLSQPTSAMSSLVKEITTLHRVLLQLLPLEQLKVFNILDIRVAQDSLIHLDCIWKHCQHGQ